MSTPPPITIDALQERVAELEAELARVRPIEAAAREAYAFFAGRRPGFAASYPRDIIVGAFEPNKPRSRTRRPTTSPAKRRRQG